MFSAHEESRVSSLVLTIALSTIVIASWLLSSSQCNAGTRADTVTKRLTTTAVADLVHDLMTCA